MPERVSPVTPLHLSSVFVGTLLSVTVNPSTLLTSIAGATVVVVAKFPETSLVEGGSRVTRDQLSRS
jgi:hypothetical protein